MLQLIVSLIFNKRFVTNKRQPTCQAGSTLKLDYNSVNVE